MRTIANDLVALTRLPRGEQLSRLQQLREHWDRNLEAQEAWNSRFGPDSLFEAWTSSSFCQAVYAANAEVLRAHLRPGFVAVEAGGGDGKLWQQALAPDARGTLVVIDPSPEVHTEVARRLPAGVKLTSLIAPVQDVVVPDADAIVCSLTLHHVAGRSAEERGRHGLSGPGKREVLQGFATALRPGGVFLLNEADVYCEIGLPSGDAQLRDHLLDSYVRRCGLGLATDLLEGRVPDEQHARVEAILLRWCLDQLAVAEVPLQERDVYELDVERWLDLLAQSGLTVARHGFTDRWRLFHQYVCQSI